LFRMKRNLVATAEPIYGSRLWAAAFHCRAGIVAKMPPGGPGAARGRHPLRGYLRRLPRVNFRVSKAIWQPLAEVTPANTRQLVSPAT
jgi:hypothetical protein